MLCFYCAEDIKADALVCRYCKRDLTYLKHLVGRISLLEQTLDELRIHIEAQGATTPQPRPATKGRPRGYHVVAVLLAVLTSIAASAHAVSTPPDVIWSMFLALLCPLPFGIWSGVTWKGRHPWAYLYGGICAGVASFATISVDNGSFDVSALVVLAVIGALLFLTGGLVGDWIERKRSPETIRPGYAELIAAKLSAARRGNREVETPAARAHIRHIADAISGFAPLLTFVASILTAYLSYRAALLPHPQDDRPKQQVAAGRER